jgi:hypothetical protein
MGRWTPLVLMAGGLAILLGTLVGIGFPIGGQNTANMTNSGRRSEVLPANVNVNSTTAGNGNTEPFAATNERNNVAQNTTTNDSQTTAQQTQPDNTNQETPLTETNQSNEPIRALW